MRKFIIISLLLSLFFNACDELQESQINEVNSIKIDTVITMLDTLNINLGELGDDDLISIFKEPKNSESCSLKGADDLTCTLMYVPKSDFVGTDSLTIIKKTVNVDTEINVTDSIQVVVKTVKVETEEEILSEEDTSVETEEGTTSAEETTTEETTTEEGTTSAEETSTDTENVNSTDPGESTTEAEEGTKETTTEETTTEEGTTSAEETTTDTEDVNSTDPEESTTEAEEATKETTTEETTTEEGTSTDTENVNSTDPGESTTEAEEGTSTKETTTEETTTEEGTQEEQQNNTYQGTTDPVGLQKITGKWQLVGPCDPIAVRNSWTPDPYCGSSFEFDNSMIYTVYSNGTAVKSVGYDISELVNMNGVTIYLLQFEDGHVPYCQFIDGNLRIQDTRTNFWNEYKRVY